MQDICDVSIDLLYNFAPHLPMWRAAHALWGGAPQATRPARKVYVGSLPVASSEAEITHFFNQMMVAANAVTPNMPGQPVLSCYINHEKRFAFVEFRTVEEASNAMALDGLGYRGEILRVGAIPLGSAFKVDRCMPTTAQPMARHAWLPSVSLGSSSMPKLCMLTVAQRVCGMLGCPL